MNFPQLIRISEGLLYQLKESEMGGTCSTFGNMRNGYKISVCELEGRRPLGRYMCRWYDNIKTEVRKWTLKGVG
jgi:hypothetical protein